MVNGKEVGFVSLLSLVVPVQECPSGIVNEENFKQIYSQFFPQGGEETVVVSRLRWEEGSGGLGMLR